MADMNRFIKMLEACEGQRGNMWNDWELRFLLDMRAYFDGREDQLDLGMTAWIPSRNQTATLHELWSKL